MLSSSAVILNCATDRGNYSMRRICEILHEYISRNAPGDIFNSDSALTSKYHTSYLLDKIAIDIISLRTNHRFQR